MPVVSNTSPILNLALTERLGLLREQFGKLAVPRAVVAELRLNESLPGSGAMRTAFAEGWIVPHDVSNAALVTTLCQSLDAGESEAIALAVEIAADTILLDERLARRAAQELELRVTGTIGVLLRAYRATPGEFRHCLQALEERAGFFLSRDLKQDVLSRLA